MGRITGDIPHDDTDDGNPLKIGGKASTSEPSAVSNGDRVDAYFDDHGRLYVLADDGVAHDAADAGNPVKIGGKASASAPSNVGANDRVNASFDLAGRLRVTEDLGTAGDVAHDAADSGNPVKIGAKAASALPTAAAADDRVNAIADLFGRLMVLASPPADLQTVKQTSSADMSSAPADLTAAPGAGTNLVIDNLIVSVGASALVVTITEETSGTVIAKLNMAANSTVVLGALGKLATAVKKLQGQTDGAGQIDVTAVTRTE